MLEKVFLALSQHPPLFKTSIINQRLLEEIVVVINLIAHQGGLRLGFDKFLRVIELIVLISSFELSK